MDLVEKTIRNCCSKLSIPKLKIDDAIQDMRRWALAKTHDFTIKDMIDEISKQLDILDPVARLRYELEWKRPADAADCLVIIANAMARAYVKNPQK
jgi:hypothetical protein